MVVNNDPQIKIDKQNGKLFYPSLFKTHSPIFLFRYILFPTHLGVPLVERAHGDELVLLRLCIKLRPKNKNK